PTRRRWRSRARRASRSGSGPWSSSAWPTSHGSQEDRLHLLRLSPEVVLGGDRARRLVRTGQGRRAPEPLEQVVLVLRIDEHACLRRDELGWAADTGGENRPSRRHALEQRLAERLDQAHAADHARAGERRRDLVVRDAA